MVVVSGWPGQKLGFGVEAYLVDSFLSHLVTRFRCGHVRANKKVAAALRVDSVDTDDPCQTYPSVRIDASDSWW